MKKDVSPKQTISKKHKQQQDDSITGANFFVQLLFHFGVWFSLVHALFLIASPLILAEDMDNPLLDPLKIQFEFVAVLCALVLSLIGCAIARFRKKSVTVKGITGFIKIWLLVDTGLILLFAIIGYFYVYASNATEASVYLLGISLKLYLLLLGFSFATTAIGYVFRQPMLHPLLKLLIHFTGTGAVAVFVEAAFGHGFSSGMGALYAVAVYIILYIVFSIIYLLCHQTNERTKAKEEYHSLFTQE